MDDTTNTHVEMSENRQRIHELCSDVSPEGLRKADSILQSTDGAILVALLLQDPELTRTAVRMGVDIGAPFGGTDKVLLNLIADRKRSAERKLANLLQAGWPPDFPEESGRTALMWAAQQWSAMNRDRVRCLIEFGADPECTDDKGRTAYDYAGHAMAKYIRKLVDERQKSVADSGGQAEPVTISA